MVQNSSGFTIESFNSLIEVEESWMVCCFEKKGKSFYYAIVIGISFCLKY